MKPEIFTDFKECGDYKLGWNDHNQAMNEWLASDEVREMLAKTLFYQRKEELNVTLDWETTSKTTHNIFLRRAKAIQEELVKEVKE